MDKKLLSILVCPVCKGDLRLIPASDELICFADALAFPIKDGIPVMLKDAARELSLEERESY